MATTSLEKRLRAIEKTIHSMPGNYHYQRVSQNCNVAVVVHSQHNLDSPHHRHLGHHGNDEEDDEDLDMDNENVVMDEEDVDDEDGVQTTLEHHIQNMVDEDIEEDIEDENHDVRDQQENDSSRQHHHNLHHNQQQHHHRQHRRHHHHHHHQLHQNPLQPEEHFENVDNIDECCQRTTPTLVVQHGQHNMAMSNDQSTDSIQAETEHHHHHHHPYENHHHTTHAHSLLL